MSSDLHELYQTVILDHYKRPRNFRPLAGASRTAEGHNPLCGDQLKVYASVARRHRRSRRLRGCGLRDLDRLRIADDVDAKGKTRAEIDAIAARFHDLVTGDALADPDELAALGKLDVLAGVREFPARVKCATFVWHALRAALEGRGESVSTETDE